MEGWVLEDQLVNKVNLAQEEIEVNQVHQADVVRKVLQVLKNSFKVHKEDRVQEVQMVPAAHLDQEAFQVGRVCLVFQVDQVLMVDVGFVDPQAIVEKLANQAKSVIQVALAKTHKMAKKANRVQKVLPKLLE